jgi:hypothetical protein
LNVVEVKFQVTWPILSSFLKSGVTKQESINLSMFCLCTPWFFMQCTLVSVKTAIS